MIHTQAQVDALNHAAEEFRTRFPGEANRYMFVVDLSVHKDMQDYEMTNRALDANVSKAARECIGSRPPQYKVRAYQSAKRAQDAWTEMKSAALKNLEEA